MDTKEIERAKTRERVRRYRARKAENATVTTVSAPVTASNVTVDTKMICKCQYFKMVNDQLVCSQCGKPAPSRGPKDKARRGIELK